MTGAIEQQRLLLARTIWQFDAVKTGDFLLSSGRRSDFYCDLRAFLAREFGAKIGGACMADALGEQPHGAFDCFGGAGYGAVLLLGATLTNAPFLRLSRCRCGFFIRHETKDHGTQKRLDGCAKAGDRAILIDDVLTSGKTLLNAAAVLYEHDITTVGAVVLLDREEGGREALEKAGLPLVAVLTRAQLLAVRPGA